MDTVVVSCSKSPYPEPYVTFNPGLLDDVQAWPWRSLQKLCKKLNLPSKAKREILVAQLREWHEKRFDTENLYSDRGSNFALMPVKVNENQDKANVSPRLLGPLRQRSATLPDGTPRAILKAKSAYSPNTPANDRKKSLCFSPFNGVKIISPRASLFESPVSPMLLA
eukprot:GILK01005651.1.p1 GENE.GILK01005651.1~~GILK01005651.1.p1  ORF type:complete len:167 (-),score=17.30 GILK01005651.1:165-665(-)